MIVINNGSNYSANGFTVSTNYEGPNNLVDGVDYSATITLDPTVFPNGIDFAWSFPAPSIPAFVYAYPDIKYGDGAAGGPVPTQTADFAALNANYSIAISGNTSDFNVAFDLWFTSAPGNDNTTTDEVMVEIHTHGTQQPGNQPYTLSGGGLTNATVSVFPNWGAGGSWIPAGWTFIDIQNSVDALTGSINLGDIFKELIWQGVLTGQEYISDIQLGAEITGGSGSLTINNLSYQWDANPTVTLAPGNNIYSVVTPGGNDIFGNGGIDTVIYQGEYSQYQIKHSGTEILVQQTSSISTLDVLNGISFVQFSNGTYDVATSTFTALSTGTAPTISSVTEAPLSGAVDAGHVVTLTLNMSGAVTVNTTGGTPTLTLNDGGTATYTGGSGSSALTFSYTVAAGQNTPDLTISAVNLNGATVADDAGNNASLSGTFNPTGTLQIDTATPTVTSVAASGTGISSGSGAVDAGHVVTLTLNMSEAVTVNTTGGTPTLTLNDGGTATYTGGSGSSALTFSYTVAAGQNTPDLTISAVNLNGATVADDAGNNASLSGTFNPTGTLQIDTATPTPPIISTDAVNANNSITLTGTAEANSTLTIYDETVLGTTIATTSGVWSFTTGTLASGAQVFTAVATDAAGNTSGPSNSVDPIIGSATTTEIAAIYNAVLQRAPTDTEVTASLAIDSTLGSAGMIAAIVDSAEAINNVYPVLQMFDLAFERFPSAATLASMVVTGLAVPQLAAAIVASQSFANIYNDGTLINPSSPVTANIVEVLYTHALGHAPTQATLNGWLNGGLTVGQAFLAMVMSQSYFDAAQPAIEQYLTTAATNNEGYPVSGTAADLNPTQVGAIYEAVLQRAPTDTEVTASLALDAATGDVGMIAALADSAAAINNVYPILQMFELAFGHFPSAATLASMVDTDLSVSQLAAAIVASQTFANTYNGGALINPNSPVTANIIEAFYSEALGHAPTQATLDGWLSGGLTVAQAFEEMVTSQSYFTTTQASIEQYLTATAINEAGLTTIDGTETTGALGLGTAGIPLTQAGLTVLGGSGALTVVASGAGDTVTELNTSTAGGTITANGAGDNINAANGANTISANGAGDTIDLGIVSTGTSVTSAQTIHAAGAGDVITFATTAEDGTALTWAGVSTVDGGNSSTGVGANGTVNFGNNTSGGSETVVVTGDLTGTTTSGGTSGIAMTTLGNVVDGGGDQVIFNNATTEVLAGTNAVNVSSASSLAEALDIAASAATASQSGGMIPANTGVIDWFQYGGNSYIVEAVNGAGTAATHNALAATDEVVKIVGLVNLSGESIAAHTLTL